MGCASSTSGSMGIASDTDRKSHNSTPEIKSNDSTHNYGPDESSNTVNISAQQSRNGGNSDGKFKEFVLMDNVPQLDRQQHAALMIQRVARGIEARGSMCKRRNSQIAESKFVETLDPLISPAENASKALMELATVTFTLECMP
jgi:hypothetical protein